MLHFYRGFAKVSVAIPSGSLLLSLHCPEILRTTSLLRNLLTFREFRKRRVPNERQTAAENCPA
jgi:hypothetical protein